MITKDDYINSVVAILNIPKPILIYNDDLVKAPRMAQISVKPNGKAKLFLKQSYESEFDFYFVTAHELRHYWQAINELSKLTDYEIGGCEVEQYNAQWAEVDAHEFAILMFRMT